MNSHHKDFIGIYENVYAEGFCEHVIEQFEKDISSGLGWDRQTSEGAPRHMKSDIALNLKRSEFDFFNNMCTVDIFFNGLQDCYNEYLKEYSVLNNTQIMSNTAKLQKTSPGEGYHVWHFEHGSIDSGHSDRILVYILYLNTLEFSDAGETEFLYQRTRITPKKNTMVIWPAAFTHTHRGNVLHGDKNKYIVTGWFNLS